MPPLILPGLGAEPSPPDPRDWVLTLPPLTAPLPRRYISPGLGPLLNQGSLPMCVAFASTGLKHWQEHRDGNGTPAFWPQWLYAECKKVDGMPGTAGTTGRAAMQVLKAQGLAIRGKPGEAFHYRIRAYYSVPLTIEAMKRAIMAYGPIVIGEQWPNSWFHPVKNVNPRPSGGIAGGHETLRYGWDDDMDHGSWYNRNSWGRYVGTTNGNFLVPYRYETPDDRPGPGRVQLWEAWKAVDVIDG